jgi:hypothetical protein
MLSHGWLSMDSAALPRPAHPTVSSCNSGPTYGCSVFWWAKFTRAIGLRASMLKPLSQPAAAAVPSAALVRVRSSAAARRGLCFSSSLMKLKGGHARRQIRTAPSCNISCFARQLFLPVPVRFLFDLLTFSSVHSWLILLWLCLVGGENTEKCTVACFGFIW